MVYIKYKYTAFNYHFFVSFDENSKAEAFVKELQTKGYVEMAEVLVGQPLVNELRNKG